MLLDSVHDCAAWLADIYLRAITAWNLVQNFCAAFNWYWVLWLTRSFLRVVLGLNLTLMSASDKKNARGGRHQSEPTPTSSAYWHLWSAGSMHYHEIYTPVLSYITRLFSKICDSIVQQHSVKLCSCWFIIKLHLLIYKLLHCSSNLSRPDPGLLAMDCVHS